MVQEQPFNGKTYINHRAWEVLVGLARMFHSRSPKQNNSAKSYRASQRNNPSRADPNAATAARRMASQLPDQGAIDSASLGPSRDPGVDISARPTHFVSSTHTLDG